jgi:hypothetical protein
MPEPTSGPICAEPYILEEHPWLSHCGSSSMHRLSKQLQPGRALTPIDVFADIAKNGSGESVRLLREHNIGPKEIEKILAENNLAVIGGSAG